ncbi:HhH-GPD base excision DNA repair protein [Gracilaria domingensis]|nr:HhH-GPD base excision DNA repair protein [Gracilaria domingensis]
MVQLGEPAVRAIIKQIGLAPQKARNIVRLSQKLCDRHDGQVPDTFEQLEQLDGVGHKTASVVMMQAFDKPAFPVDTHIHRLACRWGCGNAKSVAKTESSLKLWFPDPRSWATLHTRLILFGRQHCPARNHDMDECAVCSFAATDEARQLNRQFPKKFVPPAKHADPFSVRLVEQHHHHDLERAPARGAKRARTTRGGDDDVATRRSSRLARKKQKQ